MPHVGLPQQETIHDRGSGIDQSGKHRFASPYLREARAFVFPAVDHLETWRFRERIEVRERDQRMEECRKRRLARLAGVHVAANMAIEPDMEPVRRVFGDD